CEAISQRSYDRPQWAAQVRQSRPCDADRHEGGRTGCARGAPNNLETLGARSLSGRSERGAHFEPIITNGIGHGLNMPMNLNEYQERHMARAHDDDECKREAEAWNRWKWVDYRQFASACLVQNSLLHRGGASRYGLEASARTRRSLQYTALLFRCL